MAFSNCRKWQLTIMLTGKLKLIIYEAINLVNSKRYIGQTIHKLSDRKRQHIESLNYKNGCTLFKRALLKYGVDNFMWKVIDYAYTHDELNIKESFWISFFNTTNPLYGYNLKGGGAKPYLTQAVKDSIGNAQRGKLNHMYGKTGKDNPTSISVIILETGEIFDSVSDLCRKYTQFSLSKVCAVCRGTRYTHKKHTFRYLDDEGNIIDNGNPINKQELIKLKHDHVSKNAVNLQVLDVTNGIVYRTVVDAVGHEYKHGLYQKLRRGNGECMYMGIHWKVYN